MTPTRTIFFTALLLCASSCKPATTSQDAAQSQIAQVKAQISDIRAELNAAKKEIADNRRELDATKVELADVRKQLADAKAIAVQASTRSAESPRRDAIQKIYRELIKLNAATESGVTYAQYTERVLNAKTEIESAALALDDRTLHQSCLRVLDAYQAARDFWTKFIVSSVRYPTFTRLERERFKTYGIEFDSDGTAAQYKVSLIWGNAQTKLKELTDYLKQEGLL